MKGELDLNFENGNNENHTEQRKDISWNPKVVSKSVIGICIAIILLYIGMTSFYTVEERERAVILTFGKITDEATSGLHFKLPYPIQDVKIVPAEMTQYITIGYRESANGDIVDESEAMMITGDENIVSADAVITWKIGNIKNYLTNIDDHETFLRNSAIASIRSVMGAQKLDYAITDGKTVIQELAREQLMKLQEKYETGIIVIDLKFQDIEPPDGQVAEAFRAVTNAREEKNTKINNATKYENDRIPKARGEAQALIELAEAEKASRILNAQGDVAKFNAIYAEYNNNKDITESR
ncbi:MAG TPA: FtsH protease activity modulator HflK, partial [Candidatus Paenibacillus intestinavium]|nr:FtsH protease activity modulator HflK [Candidatus Paenibacillus intestinavium]